MTTNIAAHFAGSYVKRPIRFLELAVINNGRVKLRLLFFGRHLRHNLQYSQAKLCQAINDGFRVTTQINDYEQPVGFDVRDWQPPAAPQKQVLTGQYCRLEPLDAARHTAPLIAAYQAGDDAPSWTYLAYGPFAGTTAYADWIRENAQGHDPLFYAIVERRSNQPLGVASYLRIQPAHGALEIGHIHYADALKQTPVATEAIVLLMQHAFALGYRRVEWKCDALNAASRHAAQRLGFVFEGVFRQATVYKQRNRDTAWYAVIDRDWPRLETCFRTWLDPGNFDANGQQRQKLSALTQAPVAQTGASE